MLNRIGQQLGNYQLTSLLGQGGAAEVYLGEHILLGTKAAIKVLQVQMTPQDRQQFIMEARTIANLRHPHIVRMLEFGVERQGGIPYLVMDYAPNGTLRDSLPSGSALPLPTILPYVKQVVAALQYVHDQKLIHRDVKPENMLLEHNDHILLSDFGIVVVAHSTRSRVLQDKVGTPYYMAPEQIRGQACPASDQYSLGIVVYEWLCGAYPFDGSTDLEIAVKQINEPPPALRRHNPSIPDDVEWVVLKALAKDPQQRFASVQAFATALEQATQPASISHAVPPSKVASFPTSAVAPPPSKHHLSRRTVIVGLAGIAVLATVSSGIWWMVTPHPLYTYRGHSSAVYAVAWSPDGQRIASGSGTPTASGNPTGSGDYTVQVWDAVDGGNVFTYRGHSDTVQAVAWSPDGKRIVSGSWDKTVQVWDAADGSHVYTYRGHSDAVRAVVWSPDGRRIASASYEVQVWDAANGGNVYTYQGHSGGVLAVAWSPDGKYIASGSADYTVQIWDATNGGKKLTYRGHSNQVWSVAWSPDGTRIASSGSWDQTVQVWDAANGGNVYTYRGHSDWVKTVAWSPDGRRIASGSGDGTVQVWGAVDGGNAFTYRGHSDLVSQVAWSPDGRRIASGSDDHTVQVWDAG